MKRLYFGILSFLCIGLAASEAHAWGYSCGDAKELLVEVLDTPTSRQVGLLYGRKMEDHQWLGTSAIPLECYRHGGSQGTPWVTCESLDPAYKADVVITFNPSVAKLTASHDDTEVTVKLSCR